MDLRRILILASTGLLGATATIIGTPGAAAAAPAAPKGLSAIRTADDVRRIQMTWRPGDTTTDHYLVDVVADDVETVIKVPASTTEYRIDAPGPCTTYKMRVGAADASGAVTNTGFTTLRSLTPSYVLGMSTGREEDGTVATATWRAPAWTGYTPLTSYRVVFTRLSDGVVLADRSSTDTSFRFPGVDPARAYTIAVSTVNEFGACSTAKSLLDRYRPADPTGLVSRRLADAPGTVEVVWQAPASGPAPTYYMVGYGQDKITGRLRVDAPTLRSTLLLDPAKSWMLEVKAYNDNGGSGALTGYEPVWTPATTTAPVTTPSAAPTAEPSPSSAPVVVTAPTDDTATPATASPATEPTTTTAVVSTGTDRTPPTITATLSQPPVNGWFRAPVTVHFTCADDSGVIAGCPADILTGADNAAQRISGTAVDGAGNTATSTMTLKLDRTPPTITATVLGTPNAAGWYTSPPVIRYTCTDEVAMISTCPADTPISVDGAGQKVIGSAYDKAGNSATATVELSLDRGAPTITATVLGDANADGWYTVPPTVRFTCSDRLSGIATCPADRRLDTDGAAQTVVGTAVDKAGNTATATATLNIDRTAPTITATVVGEATADGWYRTAPTVRFSCADAGAGLAECPADVTLDGNGAGQQVTGTAVDKAGNTATTSVAVDVDRTAPAITATVVGEATADGWYNTAPTVHFTCTDEGSGTTSCPADMPVTTDGSGLVITGTTTDLAGNTASAQVTVDVDRTAPVITPTVTGTPNSAGWFRSEPTVTFECTDAVSTVATCPAAQVVTAEGAGAGVTGTAADRAANTAAAGVTVNVDKTAPVTTVAGVTDGGVYEADAVPVVSCRTTDEGSGVADQPVPATTVMSGMYTVRCPAAVDKAGNEGTAAIASYTVNPSLEWLRGLTHQYLDGEPEATIRTFDKALDKRNLAPFIAQVIIHSSGRKPALTQKEAATLLYWALVVQYRR
ncbi:fibronectin type III domain-containing protein [Actinoplanes sp. NPDC049599]|uniref:fibronectin type III domain-containing protein n=1 Tax=Actinoplanes sp. NPDC049599 TaxID=3363903 RepID=UPI00378CAA0B